MKWVSEFDNVWSQIKKIQVIFTHLKWWGRGSETQIHMGEKFNYLVKICIMQRWRWPLATSPNAKIFSMWRKICDVFSHSGEDKNEMLLQYL